MSYVPNNITVYTAAYSGCLAGLAASGRRLIDALANDYTAFNLICQIFSQSFDTQWQNIINTIPDTLEVFLIEKSCKAVWEERSNLVSTGSLTQSNYDDLSKAIIALIKSAEDNFGVSGISPLPWPAQTSSWKTLLDLDLTALPNQSFNADGVQIFGGYSWIKGNSANEVTHAKIVNGQGLNFQPIDATDYNGVTRTLPYLFLPLAEIFGVSLSGLQWQLLNTGAAVAGVAPCQGLTSTTTYMGGDPNVTYNVTLRFRGVIETKAYTGGTVLAPFVNRDGVPDGTGWNIYKLIIGNPSHTYFLNLGASNLHHIFGVDYQITIPIQGGSQVTLTADAVDGVQIWNSSTDPPTQTPISVPGITNPPQPFLNGQFLQMDVLSGIPSTLVSVPLDWTTKLRLWVSIGSDNAAANYDNVVYGIDSNSTDLGLLYKRGYGTGGQGCAAFYEIATVNPGFLSDLFNLDISNQTLISQYEGLGGAAPAFETFRSSLLQAGQVFQPINTMRPGFWSRGGSNLTNGGFTSTPTSLGIFIGAQRANSGTAYSTFIQRIRLDYNNILE
jgi:hypothetical protein